MGQQLIALSNLLEMNLDKVIELCPKSLTRPELTRWPTTHNYQKLLIVIEKEPEAN